MVTRGNQITAADINAIISKINTEENARTTGGSGKTDITTVNVGDLIIGSKLQYMIETNQFLADNLHCYCQADGGMESHSGCGAYSYTPTASEGNHDRGDLIKAADINLIEDDIDTLIAACDCNTHGCTCDTNTDYSCTNVSYCTCNWYCPAYCNPNWKILECSCYGHYTYCSCNTACQCNYNCTCDNVCNCEYN